MAKFSIAWHEDCLKYSRLTIAEKVARFERLRIEIACDQAREDFYASQIETAKAKGFDGFDPDRFMKSKRNPL